MSSAAPFEIPPQLINFKAPRRSFVLHNAKRNPVSTMFVGNLMTVPAVHVVGPHSDVDADGEVIPGTYVVEDIYDAIPEVGDEVLVFDAARAVMHILGLQPGADGRATSATSSFALGGLSLIRRHSTKEEWKLVAASGEKRAFLAEVERARITIDVFDDRNLKRRSAGMEPMPGGAEYERAAFLINQYNDLVKRNVESTLAPHQIDAMEDELELQAIAEAIAMKSAERVAASHGVDKMALFRSLLDDPKVRMLAQKEYRIKKKSSLPVDASRLEEVIKAGGTSVAGAGLEDGTPLSMDSIPQDPDPST